MSDPEDRYYALQFSYLELGRIPKICVPIDAYLAQLKAMVPKDKYKSIREDLQKHRLNKPMYYAVVQMGEPTVFVEHPPKWAALYKEEDDGEGQE